MIAVKVFAEGVIQQIKDYLPEEYQNMECRVTERQKNNGVALTGVIFSLPGQQITPLVYMEPFYDQVRKGEPMDQVMGHIADVCKQSLAVRELPESLDFMDYDSIKDYLVVQVINTKANQRMLREVPHKDMEDLSAICRIEFSMQDSEGNGSIKVTHEMIRQWKVDFEEVYQKATDNSVCNKQPVLESMESIMMEIMGMPSERKNLLQLESGEEFPKEGMYVLSNPMRLDGASVLAYPNLQEQLESVFPQGCYILPSSLHELIIVPKDIGMSPKEMEEMVREINQKEVAREVVLSDRVYEFDKETKKLCQISESVERGKDRER